MNIFPPALFNITGDITKHVHGFIGNAQELKTFVRLKPAPAQWHIVQNASHDTTSLLAPRSQIWGTTLTYTIYIAWNVHRPPALNQNWNDMMTDFWEILQMKQQRAYSELGAARFLPRMQPDSFSHLTSLTPSPQSRAYR